jgi:hypothetical protein
MIFVSPANRQEFGFEMFQTPGEASANHRRFPLSGRLAFERRAMLPDEPLRLPRVQSVRDSGETHQADGTSGQRSALQKSNPKKSVEHFARENGRVPNVGDLNTRDEFESLRPVSARVAGDRRFGMALGTVLHVAGFGGSAAIQAGAVAPFGVLVTSTPQRGTVPKEIWQLDRLAIFHRE